VLDSVAEFAKPEYRVDLFKLEAPLPGASLPALDGSAAHRDAQRWFDDMGAICAKAGIPWVMLSAGVTAAQFRRVLEYAFVAGANGFLAGRAIWWDALQAFPDLGACRTRLQSEGVRTLEDLGALTQRAGRPWQADYSALGSMQAEGELCSAYA
jgi:tagatose 1,6-diphosphate aldolase